ncbi:MAG: HepT-like ribonuclease domain-containing protein [Limisphaerales bacterium]
MRDKLIHDYGDVDYFIVWDVAARKAPDLITRLKAVIDAARDPSQSS